MANETKHTPWTMEYGSEESSIIDARGYIICTNGEDPSVVSDDEMAHIVKCVNLHDELVEALEHCKQVFLRYEINRVDHVEIEDEALKVIQNAIAKARGEV